ncbi:Alpha/Beta hydrolase protein [Mycena vitilis]|nr:Alpha/Beta hydrolase protein [Mycena vitilis]
MEGSLYKQRTTRRGTTYSYYWSPPAEDKPVIFFSHGFPSASFVWRKQVAFFQALEYGIFIPDQLGYGGTDRPTNPKMYFGRGLAQDLNDILDAELGNASAASGKIIAVGHDWGSYQVSRLLNYYPERVSAVAFLAVGYQPPVTEETNPVVAHENMKALFGYDAFAYQRFFVSQDAATLMEQNIDSFITLLYPAKPELWKDTMCVENEARKWIEGVSEGSRDAALPPYMTVEDAERIKMSLLPDKESPVSRPGLAAPLCYYKQLITRGFHEEEAGIDPEKAKVKVPLLYIAFDGDAVGMPKVNDLIHAGYAVNKVTRKSIAEADHWGLESHAGEVNAFLRSGWRALILVLLLPKLSRTSPLNAAVFANQHHGLRRPVMIINS